MSLYKFSIFKSVVEQGTFTKAAEKLGYTQSGISHAINSLENELGFQLVIRSRNGITLTPNGEEIFQYIKEIINWNERLEETVASINGKIQGKIRIGTFLSIAIKWLPDIIKNFTEAYPLIEFEIIDGDHKDISKWILDYKVDCGFGVFENVHNRLNITVLKEDKLLAVLPKMHPLAVNEKVPVTHLNEEKFIVPGEGMGAELGQLIKSNQLDLKILYQSKSDHATLAMVESGLGISILPELLLTNIHQDIAIRELEPPASRFLSFATLQEKKRSPAIELFESYVLDYLSIKQKNTT